jgi:hypothetical protein
MFKPALTLGFSARRARRAGPFAITSVNPADDPSKKRSKN